MPSRSLRFVLSRRWAVFAVVVVAATCACWWLGQWQFHRLSDRLALNAVVRVNEGRSAAPVADVLARAGTVSKDDEWRLVSATGTYDTASTVVVRYRSRDEGTGIDVVVPLVTTDGTALVVDRGWFETNPQGTDRSRIPAPPSGAVTITGWVRQDGTGSSTSVEDLSTRAISSTRIGAASGLAVYTGFVELDTEDPGPAAALTKVQLPELDSGPHFFYGLQWWFFGMLAVFGFFYLMYDEWRHGPRGERPTRRTRPAVPVRELATRAASSARPAKAPSKAERRRELVRQTEERRRADQSGPPSRSEREQV